MNKSFYIFGGTFDPVHNGHLEICRAIAQAKGIQKITLMPSCIPPHAHKQAAHASVQQRLEMLRIATADDPLFEVCDLELKLDKPSYTIDTVRKLRDIHGQGTRITWIIGADMLADLPNWKDADKLVKQIDFLVAYRSPWKKDLTDIWSLIDKSFGPEILKKLQNSLVGTPLIDISSTEIRKKASSREKIDGLVPKGVAEYVNSQGLYM